MFTDPKKVRNGYQFLEKSQYLSIFSHHIEFAIFNFIWIQLQIRSQWLKKATGTNFYSIPIICSRDIIIIYLFIYLLLLIDQNLAFALSRAIQV